MGNQIRVEPASVIAYGTEATELFGEIDARLASLIEEVVGVHYYGANAKAFKESLGASVVNYGLAAQNKMTAMADAVRAATTRISSSLGGRPVEISFDGKTKLEVPGVEAPEWVDVDTSALSSLSDVIPSRFAVITGLFAQHEAALSRTDWIGNAKNEAVGEVNRLTSIAQSENDDAVSSIQATLESQIQSAQQADAAL